MRRIQDWFNLASDHDADGRRRDDGNGMATRSHRSPRGRYFVAGQPTDLVREGDAEAVDPLGQQQLDQSGAVGVSPSAVSGWVRSGHRRLWWALAGVVAFLGLVGAGVVGTLFLNRDRESIDDKYLAALRRSDSPVSSTPTRTPSPAASRCAASCKTVANSRGCRSIRSPCNTTARSSAMASISWKP